MEATAIHSLVPRDEAPKHAERLPLNDYWKLVRKPSRYAPGAMAMVPEMACPGCAVMIDPVPRDFFTVQCVHCGLHMRMECFELKVWREPAEMAAVRIAISTLGRADG